MATATQVAAQPAAYSGVWSWITTVDHKRIGILYGVSALVFFLIAGIEALIMRLQLATPNAQVVSAETFNQLFTMHGTAMIFLGVMPFSAAFFNYVIPLLIGARDVAFPRLNAFSFWVFLSGGILLHASFLFNAAPNAGWFGYANLTSPEFSPGLNVDFWLLSLQILGIASLAAAFNFLVTIINMRAPGMSLMRLPLFAWMTLVTSILMVLAFPCDYRRFDAAPVRPLLRYELLYHPGRRRSQVVAAPVLGVRSSRGLYPDPSGYGYSLRGGADVL